MGWPKIKRDKLPYRKPREAREHAVKETIELCRLVPVRDNATGEMWTEMEVPKDIGEAAQKVAAWMRKSSIVDLTICGLRLVK